MGLDYINNWENHEKRFTQKKLQAQEIQPYQISEIKFS
jgi:hypothetical protein